MKILALEEEIKPRVAPDLRIRCFEQLEGG